MTAFLLTWNPTRWQWADLAEHARGVHEGRQALLRWSCGRTKDMPIGSRVFLLRQGEEPKGIVASGWVVEAPFEEPHWDLERRQRGDFATYIRFVPDALLGPNDGQPLDVRRFRTGALSEVTWGTRGSGIRLSAEAAAELEEEWTRRTALAAVTVGEADDELGRLEGKIRWRMVKHRSRERSLRDAKIVDAKRRSPGSRLRCEVPGCGFDFEERYGPLGRGFAHVHHLRPIAESDGPRETILEDLAVICANCHAMIHVGGENRPLKGLISSLG